VNVAINDLKKIKKKWIFLEIKGCKFWQADEKKNPKKEV